jgi:uncharacterized iron-regulated membrane protein
MTLRTFIFWPHLAAGVIAGSVILLMSVTGVILTYERQVIAWSDSRFQSAPPAHGAERLPVESILAAFGREYPGVELTSVTVASDPDAAVSIAAGGRTFGPESRSRCADSAAGSVGGTIARPSAPTRDACRRRSTAGAL